MSYARERSRVVRAGNEGTGRVGYIPRDIYPYRRRTRIGWRRRGRPVRRSRGGSRTKLLKMDEISDLPASGLPARSSRAIRQVSLRRAGAKSRAAYSRTGNSPTRRVSPRTRDHGYYNGSSARTYTADVGETPAAIRET